MESVLTIKNKGEEYHVLLPKYSPAKLCSMLWWAIEREGCPHVHDMGRLAMFIIEQCCKIPGARLIGGERARYLITRKTKDVYTVDRPERSLQLTMHNVVLDEDEPPALHKVWAGNFIEFKKYLPTILENNA